MGIGMLLIAAALGYGALRGGAPAPIAQATVATSTPARELATLTPGPALLQDRLVYLRMVDSAPGTAGAIPRSPNDTFLVVLLWLPSNSNLYPEDLDWTVRDQAGREFTPAGFGIPLQYATEVNAPAVYSFFGRLLAGPVLVTSKGNDATINLVFVVPRETHGGTLFSPHKKTSRVFSIEERPFKLESDQISTVQFEDTFVEQPNGSENWTFAP